MKNISIYLCLLSLSLFSCASLSKKDKEINDKRTNAIGLEYPILAEGEIYKIDSTENYYLIYLKDKKTKYKIISPKEDNSTCKKVEVNETFSFNLKNITNKENIPKSNKAFMPVNYLIMERCIEVKNNEKICAEGDIDLYKSANLNGLCYKISL